MSEIRVTGVESALRGMRQTVKDDSVRVADGLVRAAQVVKTRADKYVPVDKGALKASGRIEANDKQGLAAEVVVAYGSDEAYYALWVHENMNAHHTPPTCARWLSKAVREMRGTVTNMMKRQVSAATVKTIGGVTVS